MAETVLMPKAGLTMDAGTIVTWLVDVGESVTAGQAVAEVETEKITIDVEAHVGGVLLRRLDAGAEVPVGEAIAIIGDPAEDISRVTLWGDRQDALRQAADTATSETAEATAATSAVGSSPVKSNRVAASPVSRRLANDLGVDLAGVTGTGPEGRITRSDVEAAAPVAGSVEPASRMREAIAKSMSLSATIPQFSLERDVDVTDLEARLGEVAAAVADERRPTIADAIASATARALRAHPQILRSWENGAYRIHNSVNLGIAVALPHGIVVPVIADADRQSVTELAARRRSLQEKVGSGSGLSGDEASGAVFTVSNLGALGVDRFRALVNPPEPGILAVGRVSAREGRRFVTLNLSVDHRVADGAEAARLLGTIAESMETKDAIDMLLADT